MSSVVVPIFNAPEETFLCLKSLVRETKVGANVILINDASDDPRIKEVLQGVPSHWRIVENQHNIGFVASVNFGMALATPDDVVLLNADTEVTSDWLETLEHCLQSDDSIASVSPLTNNGEIASIPLVCQSNPYPSDANLWAEACKKSASTVDAPDWVNVPTTVGFCMLIRREALDTVGYFDEEAFGRGYGEENDWCQRALQEGWRHVLCDQAFVAHRGGASFAPLGLSPGGGAMQKLLERYPSYMNDVASFIECDPLAGRRTSILEYYQNARKRGSCET